NRVVGITLVEHDGTGWAVEGIRILGRAGALFDRLVTFLDPFVNLEVTIRRTEKIPALEQLKRGLLADLSVQHHVESGWASPRNFGRKITEAETLQALFAVLTRYFPKGPPAGGSADPPG